MMLVLDVAPLCPAGHLPRKGGDRLAAAFANRDIDDGEAVRLPISPLAGEMSGRTEGGAVERQARMVAHGD